LPENTNIFTRVQTTKKCGKSLILTFAVCRKIARGQNGWIVSLFLRVYGARRSQGPKTRKRKRGQYPAILTKKAWEK